MLEYVTSPSTLKRQRPKTYAAIVAALNKITDERIQRVMDIYGPFWRLKKYPAEWISLCPGVF